MKFDKVDPIAIYSQYLPLENNSKIINYQLTVETNLKEYFSIWAMIDLRVENEFFQEITAHFPIKGRGYPMVLVDAECAELNDNEDQIICYLSPIHCNNKYPYSSTTSGVLEMKYDYQEFLQVQQQLNRLYEIYSLLK